MVCWSYTLKLSVVRTVGAYAGGIRMPGAIRIAVRMVMHMMRMYGSRGMEGQIPRSRRGTSAAVSRRDQHPGAIPSPAANSWRTATPAQDVGDHEPGSRGGSLRHCLRKTLVLNGHNRARSHSSGLWERIIREVNFLTGTEQSTKESKCHSHKSTIY